MKSTTQYTAQDLLSFLELEYEATESEYPEVRLTDLIDSARKLAGYNFKYTNDVSKELFDLLIAKYKYEIVYRNGVEYFFFMKKSLDITPHREGENQEQVYEVKETLAAADAKELVNKLAITVSFKPVELKADGAALRTEASDKPLKPCTWAVSAGDPIPKCIYCGKRDICNKPS